MSMREDIEDMKKEVNEIKNEIYNGEKTKEDNESLAMELIKDQKKQIKDQKIQNKRLFIIILVLIFALIIETCYLVFLLNDIETEYVTTETYEQDVEGNGDITNSYVVNGGDIND